MHRGAVGMIDALGWKGIWSRHSEDVLLDKIKKLRAEIERRFAGTNGILSKLQGAERLNHAPKLQVCFLSDTIVIAAGVRDYSPLAENRHEILDGTFAWFVAISISLTLDAAARFAPSVVYRGAISVGDFVLDDPFLLGPAIDEAAELYEKADGAIVITAPSAIPSLRRAVASADSSAVNATIDATSSVLEYVAPMKGGATMPTLAISPFGMCRTWAECVGVKDGIFAALGTDPKYATKRENTTRFLEAAHAQWTETMKSLRRA